MELQAAFYGFMLFWRRHLFLNVLFKWSVNSYQRGQRSGRAAGHHLLRSSGPPHRVSSCSCWAALTFNKFLFIFISHYCTSERKTYLEMWWWQKGLGSCLNLIQFCSSRAQILEIAGGGRGEAGLAFWVWRAAGVRLLAPPKHKHTARAVRDFYQLKTRVRRTHFYFHCVRQEAAQE